MKGSKIRRQVSICVCALIMALGIAACGNTAGTLRITEEQRTAEKRIPGLQKK